MPIDDIQFLYKNHIKENIVLLVDSNKRDKRRWRSPAEFVVDFPEPFKNVFGVELLNASVARTMFTIDKHNNQLSFLTNSYIKDVYEEPLKDYKYTDIFLAITDYKDANKMLDEISNLLEGAANSYDKTFSAVTAVDSQSAESDITTKQFLKFSSTKSPFIINSRLSTISKTIGFSLTAHEDDANSYRTLDACLKTNVVSFSTIHLDHTEQIIYSDTFSITPDVVTVIEETVTNKTLRIPLMITKPYSSGIFIKYLFRSEDDLTNYVIKKYTYDDIILQVPTEFEISTETKFHIEFYLLIDNLRTILEEDKDNLFISKSVSPTTLTPQSVTITDDMGINIIGPEGNSAITDDQGVFIQSLNIEIDELQNIHLLPNTFIHVLFKDNTTNNNVIFLCEYYKSGEKYYIKYEKPDESEYFNHIEIKLRTDYDLSVLYGVGKYNEEIKVNSVESLFITSTRFELTPPGIINFATENYVTLHIKEIEEHIRGSYDANDVSPGIAMLNVDVTSGYADNATEFTRVEYKEFHPIGKLSRLHFRLQRKLTNELYDCKGVDVHYLLSIKMLNPAKLNQQTLEYSLNPNYDPDYQGFMKSEFDNVESDEEIESRRLKDIHYEKEHELLNLKNNIDRTFANTYENENERYDSESESQSDSEYESD